MKKQASRKKPEVENENAFKHLIGRALLKKIAESLAPLIADFSSKQWLALAKDLEPLEMKPRVRFLRDELKKVLPDNYKQAVKILLQSARQGTLTGFDLWPYSEFIQTYGHGEIEVSLAALRELTDKFTSEFAVRPYLKIAPERTLKFLIECTQSPDPHLRRWASEGSRPRLPWGERLQNFIEHPESTLPILRALRFDDELYVRKSVANHLNDLSKDHPDFVIAELARWQSEAPPEHRKSVEWIIRHALRSLIKAGHPGALKLMGVSTRPQIEFKNLELAKRRVRLGEAVEFSFTIESRSGKPQKLVVDYIIHFVKASRSTSPKVFKLKTFEILPRQTLTLNKAHSLKKVTVRDYHLGAHAVEIQINGASVGRLEWHLIK